jgi:hypothetical protein
MRESHTSFGEAARLSDERDEVRVQLRAARAMTEVLRDESMEDAARREALLAASLEIVTYLNDRHPTPLRRERVRALGGLVGRSPEIEDAKEILAHQHGITPHEAWALLRRISQRTNRKLRLVAHEIVIRNGDGVRAGAIAGAWSADGDGAQRRPTRPVR